MPAPVDLALTILPPWGRPTVPIGLGYLSAALADAGFAHEVLDLNLQIFGDVDDELRVLWRPQHGSEWVDAQRFPCTLQRLEPAVGRAVEALARSPGRVVGFSVQQSNARLSVEVARRLRQRCPERRIIFGGPGVIIEGERRQIPPGVVDLFVLGEGELTLLRIAERLRQGTIEDALRDDLQGTLRSPGAATPALAPPLDVRARPLWPRYERFAVERYPDDGAPLPLLTSRGCFCRCSFCGDYPFWGKLRSRPGAEVAEEIAYHVRHYGVRCFEVNDLAINGDLDALDELCESVIARGLGEQIQWSSYAALRSMPDELWPKLRRAGCVMLRFGLESASDAVLQRMRKPHRAADAAVLLAACTAAKVQCNVGLMVGFPDETEAELRQTIAFVQAHQAHIFEVESLSVFYIKPLSEVDRDPERFGVRLPDDPAVRWNHWLGRDGSTYERRAERAERLAQAIERTSIRFSRANIIGL